jgi:uncharacterized protein (DUF4213/DUF364 family)
LSSFATVIRSGNTIYVDSLSHILKKVFDSVRQVMVISKTDAQVLPEYLLEFCVTRNKGWPIQETFPG